MDNWVCDYLSKLEFKLNYISKSGLRCRQGPQISNHLVDFVCVEHHGPYLIGIHLRCVWKFSEGTDVILYYNVDVCTVSVGRC